MKTLNFKAQQLLEIARKNHAERLARGSPTVQPSNRSLPVGSTVIQRVLTDSTQFHSSNPAVDFNQQQTAAIELAMRGQSFNLIGAAGTGKTTTTREIIAQLVRLPHITPLQAGTKHLIKEAPGIVVISFTNKAVNNLKKFLPEELQKHCLTYHKLLQFEPVQYETEDGKKSMRFEPRYFQGYKLPHISCIIVEEGSMVGEDLHQQLLDALPYPDQTQFIFLGDLNQLPPIFGPSILGFKIVEQQTVELTHVYRQALQSPIITLAHRVREGRGFEDHQGRGVLGEELFLDDRGEHGKVTIRPWKKKLPDTQALKVVLQSFLLPLVTADDYDFDNTAILCPFNKSFGCIELNKHIANALGKKREAEIYEVIARYNKSYWAVGDRVLVDRREAIIVDIKPTAGYSGPVPCSPSKTMDRWGRDPVAAGLHDGQEKALHAATGVDILETLAASVSAEEEAKNLASHTIKVEFLDTGTQQELKNSGQINNMLFSYVLTVHKSQGSEWRRVIVLLHYTHNVMLSRELLYTAFTRARHELFVICEPDRKEIYNSITRAAKSPEIAGVSLQEKAAYFSRKKASIRRLGSED